MIHRHISHIASRSLCLTAQHIEQLIFHHKVKKFPCLRRQLPVHFLSCRHDLIGGSRGSGISLLKIHGLINIFQLLQPQSLPSAVMELFGKGHKVFLHLTAKGLHLLLSIAVAVHAIISQLQIILIPHLTGLGCTVFHKAVKNLIQLFGIFLKKCRLGLPGLGAHAPILMNQIGAQQGKVQLLAVKGNFRAGNELVVLQHQSVFLLHQRNQLFIHGLLRNLHVFKGHRPDLLLQISSAG